MIPSVFDLCNAYCSQRAKVAAQILAAHRTGWQFTYSGCVDEEIEEELQDLGYKVKRNLNDVVWISWE